MNCPNANGKQEVTVLANYSHVNGINCATWSASVPLPIFDRLPLPPSTPE